MDAVAGRARAATVEVESGTAAGVVVRVAGELTLESTPPLWARTAEVATAALDATEIDVAAVPSCDFAGATWLVLLRRRLTGTAGAPRWRGLAPHVARLVQLVEAAELVPPATGAPPKEDEELFERVGARTWTAYLTFVGVMDYVGTVVAALASSLVRPSQVRWKDVVSYMARAGADALPIVALINLLMGVILAFQGVDLLGQLGFEAYTPVAVAVSVVLELGPLMTAILVAGRSGSAFAAEIGTMKVNEEVDALQTMGLDSTRFLVVPKVIALSLMMPLLVVFADACGLIGGLAIGVTALDMTIAQYLQKSFEHVDLSDAAQGLIKGECYAVGVAIVGCYRGLRTETGAQGVGLSATAAVVTSLFLIIVLDAILTVIFTYA